MDTANAERGWRNDVGVIIDRVGPVHGLYKAAPAVSRETTLRLSVYVALVQRWADTVSLLSRADRQTSLEQHVIESLALLPHLGPDGSAADLGSGAGFPGLVLAIASGRHFTLIEANRRKAAFLQEAIRVTSAPARVFAGRIENLHDEFPLVTARAVAPMEAIFTLIAPRLAAGGRGVFLKGQRVEAELDAARGRWSFEATCHPEPTVRGLRIVSVTALRARGGGTP